MSYFSCEECRTYGQTMCVSINRNDCSSIFHIGNLSILASSTLTSSHVLKEVHVSVVFNKDERYGVYFPELVVVLDNPLK